VDQPNSSSLGQHSGEQAFPRLSINHLLLLTFTVSVVLVRVAPSLEDQARMVAEYRWRPIAGLVADSVASGIKLFGFIVLVRGWLRGQRLATAPGHWFFLILGPYVAFALVSNPIYGPLVYRWAGHQQREVTTAFVAISAAIFLVGFGVCVRAVKSVERWRWKLCMAVMSAWLLSIAVSDSLYVVQSLFTVSRYNRGLLAAWLFLQLVFAGTFFVASVIDGIKSVRRDWLHYLALAAILLDFFATVATVGSIFLR